MIRFDFGRPRRCHTPTSTKNDKKSIANFHSGPWPASVRASTRPRVHAISPFPERSTRLCDATDVTVRSWSFDVAMIGGTGVTMTSFGTIVMLVARRQRASEHGWRESDATERTSRREEGKPETVKRTRWKPLPPSRKFFAAVSRTDVGGGFTCTPSGIMAVTRSVTKRESCLRLAHKHWVVCQRDHRTPLDRSWRPYFSVTSSPSI